jgi:mannosyltransferase OCH1-like enzyme
MIKMQIISQKDEEEKKIYNEINKKLKIAYPLKTNYNIVIPTNIFQTWHTKFLPPLMIKSMSTIQRLNPRFKYFLYDDNDCREFIKTHFKPDVLWAYDSLIPGAYKADLWRYCVLYEYGGVYADVDTLCLGKLDDFIGSNSAVFLVDFNSNKEEGCHNLANGFIAIEPRSPIMKECILRVVHNVENNIVYSNRILDFSGPGVLGRSVNRRLKLPEESSFVGKEGNIGDIHLLWFEPNTEFVKDLSGNALFQNKNGNKDLIRLYEEECRRVNCVDWSFNTALGI